MVLSRRSFDTAFRSGLLAATALVACVALAPDAHAQAGISSPFDRATADDPDARMLLEAEQLVYDYDQERVSAVGSVEIYYKGYAVEAAEVIYDQGSQRVYARGGVKVTEPDGNVVYADSVELSDDFREGFLQELTLVTPERARFAAATAERTSEEITIFNRGVYTACEPCRENPDRPPIWQFKARRIIHNEQEKVVQYEDGFFEVFGVPIAYLPYFSHPDPTVKRKSGFLQPSFHYASEVGFGVGIPYFWALAPNYDVTAKATGFSNQGLLTDVQWRHRLVNGAYSVRGAFIAQANPEDFTTFTSDGIQTSGFQSDGDVRGFVSAEGAFDINEFWQWGFQGTLLSDSKFLDDYYFANRTEIRDTVYLTGLSARNYFDARVINYQILQDYNDEIPFLLNSDGSFKLDSRGNRIPHGRYDDPDGELPTVHPVVDHNYVFDQPLLGGQVSVDSNFLSLSRSDPDFTYAYDGAQCPLGLTRNYLETDHEYLEDYEGDALARDCILLGVPGNLTRFVTQANWERTFVTGGGQVLTPFASLRGDFYAVDVDEWFTTPDDEGGGIIDNFINTGSDTVVRSMPTIGLEGRWPILVSAGWGYQIFEPTAQLIARPDAQNNWTGTNIGVPDETYLPNEDAISLVFDDTTLFERDKFSGYDLMEGGTRLNAGVRYRLQATSGIAASGLFGQSYHLAGENPFPLGSGLESDRSDYVGALYVSPIPSVELGSRFRLDEDDFDLRRHDFQVRGSFGRVSGAAIYTNIAALPADEVSELLADNQRWDPGEDLEDFEKELVPYRAYDRSEIQARLAVQLSDQWKIFGGARYELEGPPQPLVNPATNEVILDADGEIVYGSESSRWISQAIGVGWENECVALALQYERIFVQDGNVEPDERVTFSLKLRTVTEARFSTSIADQYLNN